MNTQYLQMLQNLGLTENESKVYLAGITLGPTTILELSRTSSVRRTTVYPTVESLKTKGLMKEITVGFKTKFQAENPENLELLFEKQKRTFTQQLPGLQSLFQKPSDQSAVQYYRGRESVQNMYRDMARDLKPGDFYYVISDLNLFFNVLDEEFLDKYKDTISKIGIDARILSNKGPKFEFFKTYEQNYDHKIKMLPKRYEVDTDVMITPFRVTILRMTDILEGFTFENPAIIQTQKTMFEMLWDFTEQYS